MIRQKFQNRDILQYIDNFLLLKKQHGLIQAWLNLKKNMRKQKIKNNYSKSCMEKFSKNKELTPKHIKYFPKDNKEDKNQYQTSQIIRNIARTSSVHCSPNKEEYINSESNKIKQNINQHFDQRPLSYNCTLKDQAIAKIIKNDNEYDQIVFDRLHKISQKFNRIVRKKHLTQQTRIHFDSPIQYSRISQKKESKPFQNNFEINYHQSVKICQKYPQYKFYESNQNKSSFEWKTYTNLVQSNIVYNMKEKPNKLQKTQPVNINKIRQIMHKRFGR